MPAIEVSHLTKEYRLGALQGLKQTLLNTGARLAGRKVLEQPLFKALDDVSFSIKPGEVVGIIGHNGAGKSTLLKMLARISTPTSGSVKVNGRIAPLIEVGAGFVPDFTGRENVYLNGSILGMSKNEIDSKFDEIVDFAEMAEFIDTPVKRYSSGMQVKLAFAVATSIESEILIVDEVLAVGDLAFQRKCFDRMEDIIRRQGRTVLLVSHNLRQVERLCSRVLLLERGRLVVDAGATEACNEFYQRSDLKIARDAGAGSTHNGRLETSADIDFLSCDILNQHGAAVTTVEHGSDLLVRFRFRVRNTVKEPIFGVGVHTTDFLYLSTSQSLDHLAVPELSPGEHEVSCRFTSIPILPGVYSIRVGVALGNQATPSFYGENLAQFQVTSKRLNRAWATTAHEGFFAMQTRWRMRLNSDNVADNAELGATIDES